MSRGLGILATTMNAPRHPGSYNTVTAGTQHDNPSATLSGKGSSSFTCCKSPCGNLSVVKAFWQTRPMHSTLLTACYQEPSFYTDKSSPSYSGTPRFALLEVQTDAPFWLAALASRFYTAHRLRLLKPRNLKSPPHQTPTQ